MKKISLYILLMVITASVFGQNVYVVTKTTDPNPFTDKFNNDDALCDPDMYGTLQWAINKVNYNGGESRIEFNIPGTGVHEISSNSYFPQIKNPVIIDGTTQAGYTTGSPVVEITGQMKTQYGFNVYNTTVTIKGLHISNFANSAILLTNCSHSKIIDNKICNIASSGNGLQIFASNYTEIYGNRIEIDALPSYGRSLFGIYIDKSEYCIVGSIEQGKANTIANCYKAGVYINGDKFNKVSGNIIYNNPAAILLGPNANGGIQPPVITSYTNGILSGTALPNSTVEVFGSTGEENANEYLVSVVADERGEWSVEVNCSYSAIMASTTTIEGTSKLLYYHIITSEFYCSTYETKSRPIPSDACLDWCNFIPEDVTQLPIKYVSITLHVFQNNSGGDNFPQTPESNDWLINTYIRHLNYKFSHIVEMNLPTSSPYITDTRIQFVVEEIYYHQSDYGNTYSTSFSYGSNLYNNFVINNPNVINKYNTVHIFLADEKSGLHAWGAASGIGDKKYIKVADTYDYYLNNNNFWMPAGLLGHELGHSLGLMHTWCGDDWCDDTPYNPNCWSAFIDPNVAFVHCNPEISDCDIPSNNLMDYNACQCAITKCQIGLMHYNLMGYDGNIKDALIPDYCEKNEDTNIDTDVIWSFPLNLKGDLIITNSSTLTIKCKLSLPQDSKIIVERGSQIIIDGGIVTNICGEMWDGIIVQGDWGVATGVPDPGPAQLIMKNNSIIEYAKKAVYSDWNGVVKISDSKFVNCPIGVELASYDNQALEWSTLPNLKPRAYVYRSEFITDNNFIETPESHINIYNVDNIYLKGNKYLNTTATSDLSGIERGKGIFAINSSFSVIENRHLSNIPDVPMSAEDKSYFDGLYYGIQAENTTAQSIKIRNCEFLNYDRIGAYLKNFNALTITTNIFDSYEFMEEAGLYLEGCNAYHVENNKFYDWTFGLIVNNSGPTANEIYRNSFFNNSYSLNAYHTNANLNGSTGLFIHCNKFNNSNSHFDSNILVAEGKVKREQGYLHPTNSQYNVSAANLFSTTMLSGAKAFKTSSSTMDYIYYCNQGDITDISGFTSNDVSVHHFIIPIDNSLSCQSGLPGTHLINPEMEISAITNDITGLQTNITSLIDGGNTSVVLQKVQNLKPNNFNKTCSELLSISPYLSDTVLVTFMQTSVDGHTIAKTNVLLANSPLPENALTELENMNLPLPHKNTIYLHQSGKNPVVLRQREIDGLVFQKELLVNDYVRYGLQSDSLEFAKDSLISYLNAENNYQAKCILIPVLIEDKNYNDARTQINELVFLASSENPLLQRELNDFADLQKLIILTDTCKTIDSYRSVIQSRLDLVERIAYDNDHKCRAQAQTMLTIAGLDEFEPEFIYPVENRYMELGSRHQIDNENFDLNDLVEVYPNPASKEIWIEYLILKDKPVAKIEIFNIEGQLIITEPIRSGFGVEKVNISGLSEGNYIIKLGEFSKKISVIK